MSGRNVIARSREAFKCLAAVISIPRLPFHFDADETLGYLHKAGARGVTIVNRSVGRAAELARQRGG